MVTDRLTQAVRAVVEAAREWDRDEQMGTMGLRDSVTALEALLNAPNEPMPWGARPMTWGGLPAGWFVKNHTKDEWYEVLGSESTAAGQSVTLKLPNGKTGSWIRDPKGEVFAVAGTEVEALNTAIENLVAAGFAPEVL